MHYMYVTVHNVQHYIHFVRCVCVSYMYVTHTITQRTKLHESNCTQRTTLHLCYKYTTYSMHYMYVTLQYTTNNILKHRTTLQINVTHIHHVRNYMFVLSKVQHYMYVSHTKHIQHYIHMLLNTYTQRTTCITCM